MVLRRLVYLGPSQRESSRGAVLRCEGEPIAVETVWRLERRRSPWLESRPHVRVIVGSHPERADLLLHGDGVYPEHVRMYYPRDEGGPLDLRAVHDDSMSIDGQAIKAHEWQSLVGGEELEIGPWRWRYEVSAD